MGQAATITHLAASEKENGFSAQRREKTREQILEAAHRALTQEGYERITTRRIAEEADVNVATLHYYFGNKEALLSETMRYAQQKSAARIQAAVVSAPTAAVALERAFSAVWEIVRERPGIVRYDLIVRGLRIESAKREAQTLYSAFRRLMEDILERHIREGGVLPPHLTVTNLAHYVISAVDGIVLQHTLFGDDAVTQSSLQLIMQNALSLMRAEKDTTNE